MILTIRTFAKAKKTIKFQLKSELPWPVYPKSITWKLLFSGGIEFCWVGGVQEIKIWWGTGESTGGKMFLVGGETKFSPAGGDSSFLSPPPDSPPPKKKPCPALGKPCLLGLGTRITPHFMKYGVEDFLLLFVCPYTWFFLGRDGVPQIVQWPNTWKKRLWCEVWSWIAWITFFISFHLIWGIWALFS